VHPQFRQRLAVAKVKIPDDEIIFEWRGIISGWRANGCKREREGDDCGLEKPAVRELHGL
jgi:hypothetical protein